MKTETTATPTTSTAIRPATTWSHSPDLERILKKSEERLKVAEQQRQHQQRLREQTRSREALKPFAFD